MNYTIPVVKVETDRQPITFKAAADYENQNPRYGLSFGSDGIYTSLSPRLQKVADRLYYTPNRSYGQTPQPNDLPEDSEKSYGLTDFSFVTRPLWAGGGYSFDIWED